MAKQIDQVPKRICVIGAGSTGLAALKYLSQTPYFKTGSWSVIAYESRSNVGGLWNPSPPTEDPPFSAVYDSLTTNLPHPIMAYTEYMFPPSTPLFPAATVVQTYLESYASHFNLLPLIRFDITVTHATWVQDHWRVTLSTGEALDFDHLVIANGHYRLPNIPDIPGLSHWMETNIACHSARYRRPDELGRKILVVGNGHSGKDIVAELRNHGRIVIHSVSGSTNVEQRGNPLQFFDDGRVLFEHGNVEEDIDYCILATGFQMDFPFFDEDTIKLGNIPIQSTLPSDVYNSRFHVFPLAKFMFPMQSRYPTTSVAFMTLPIKVIPFPIAEAQARAIVKAFIDPASLNLKKEAENVLSRSRAIIASGASSPLQFAKAWSRFKEAEQWDYRDDLFAYAAESGDCPATKVTAWQRELNESRAVLRAAWVELEKNHESQKWVEGVGEGGVQEWVEMMYRLLRHAQT